jgi:membrane associated rhomboid family serine protease
MLSDRDYVHSSYQRHPYGHSVSVVKAIIIANAVVFLLQLLGGPRFSSYLTLSYGDLRHFELWRLGTHMFAHGGFMHILVNMWGIHIFGKPLEERIGGHRFLHLYFISGLVGAVAWLFFNSQPLGLYSTGELAYPSVLGASGALFGVLTAAAMTFPNRMYMLLFPPIPMRLKTLAIVFGAIEVISLLNQSGGRIARLAHLGGMLGGYAYMRWFSSSNRQPRSPLSPLAWFRKKRGQYRQNRFRRTEPGNGPNSDSDVSTLEVDRILDKIGREGISALSSKEREILEKAREQLKQRH